MNILNLFKRKYPRKVLLHTPTGDMIAKVSWRGIVKVPWFLGTCPFHIEKDGSVTLRLMWGLTPSKGYGQIYSGIRWERIEK